MTNEFILSIELHDMENSNIAFEFTLTLVKSYLLPILFGLVCAFFGSWQGRRSLKKRNFRNLMNFSLNIVENGHLKIRTLIEKPCKDVFLTPSITKLVNQAANKTTSEDSLLPIDKEHYWVCLNNALNEVSQRFAEGFLRLDIEQSGNSDIYVMCLTFEVADAKKMKTKKIRSMLIKKSILENFPEGELQVERPTHNTRITTLRQLARDYQDEKKKHRFIDVELCV